MLIRPALLFTPSPLTGEGRGEGYGPGCGPLAPTLSHAGRGSR
jgi:hypothetical protein